MGVKMIELLARCSRPICEKRTGVQAAARVQPNAESAVRYLVVTRGHRTYHESFCEAREEFRLRRVMTVWVLG